MQLGPGGRLFFRRDSASVGGDEELGSKRSAGNFFQTGFGLAIITFLLTSIFGGMASLVFANIQSAQTTQETLIEAQGREISALRDALGKAILRREIDSELVLNSYGAMNTDGKPLYSSDSDAYITKLWDNYLDSYRDENLAVVQNHALIAGHTEDELDPTRTTPEELFWYYLDLAIQPRFDSLHNCLEKAHAIYVSTANHDHGANRARDVLKGCWYDGGFDHRSYLGHNIVGWGDFRNCINDYLFLLDNNLRAQRTVWRNDSFSWRLLFGKMKKNDARRIQDTAWNRLPQQLLESCGEIEPLYDSQEMSKLLGAYVAPIPN